VELLASPAQRTITTLIIVKGIFRQAPRGHSVFRATRAAKDFLLHEGTDLKYGARHLKRAIERHLVYSLASLLATDQVTTGDTISVDWNGMTSGLMFLKKA